MSPFRRVLRGGLLALTLGGLLASPGVALRLPSQVDLPSPTGPNPVGTVALHLVDRSRAESLGPGVQRELMVRLWYPAKSVDRRERSAYLPSAVWEAYGLSAIVNPPQTHAFEAAPASLGGWRVAGRELPRLPWQDRSTFPVVVYSHGWGSNSAFGTTLIEELASQGYVVAAIDHPYDAGFVQFPDGRLVAGPSEPDPADADLSWWDTGNNKLLPVLVADVSSVLDALEELNSGANPDAEGTALPQNLGGALDLRRVGMFGHSMGGITMFQVLRDDARVGAGLSLDGGIPQSVRATGVDKPIMLMRSEQPDPHRVTETTWQETEKRSWQRSLRMTGSMHNTYTDLAFLCPGETCGGDAGAGSIDARRAADLQRTYVTAFFGQHLKGNHSSPLNDPSPKYPEIIADS